jgi:hypothetical protein
MHEERRNKIKKCKIKGRINQDMQKARKKTKNVRRIKSKEYDA